MVGKNMDEYAVMNVYSVIGMYMENDSLRKRIKELETTENEEIAELKSKLAEIEKPADAENIDESDA
ncbi:hypothetical protein LJC49_06720 [Ruminococcaceae bacterium OttesenSCG-928-I18]|nr:hypothetical protein [Ruminococcaceae bacterium OttesenSCG-928-I18]